MALRLRLTIVAAAALFAIPAAAQSRLIFPRIVFQQGRWSGVAIANPGTADALVTIASFNPDGSVFADPVTIEVKAGAQYAALASQFLPVSDAILQSATPQRIWLLATSPAADLTGFYLEGNDLLDFMDGATLESNGTDLLVPLIENSGSSITEINLVNPDGDEEAEVTIDFLRDDGGIVDSRTSKIPKSGALLGPLADYFALSYAAVTALRIRSDLPVTCHASIFRSSDNSQVTISAVDASLPSKSLHFPQLAQGATWSTSLGLINLGSEQAVVTISAYRPDGALFSAPLVSENPATRLIPPGGSLRVPAASLFGFQDSELQQGWIKAETTTTSLAGYVEYGAGTNRAIVAAGSDGSSSSLFSHQALQPPYFTGLAVLNTGSLAANVEVVSLQPDGQMIGKSQRLLKPRQRESLLIQQWVASAADASGGSVLIKSDTPTVTTQLFGTDTLAALSNVPPQAVPEAFNPGASIPSVAVTPPLAVVETKKTQRFTSSGAASVSWRVNGIVGGDATYGTISADGTYAAPAVTPDPATVTVEAVATEGGQSAGATLDVVQRETLTQGLTLVTAVAYVESLQRFFVAEQALLSSAPHAYGAAAVDTRITEPTPAGGKDLFATIPADSIGKMLPFQDGNGTDYLLLAGTASGNIYRLSIGAGKELLTVESGFNSPISLALDPVSGDLLVSEADKISVVQREKFDPTAAAGSALSRAAGSVIAGERRSLVVTSPQGIVFDRCTRALYVLTGDGRLIQLQGNRLRTLLTNLNAPRQMQALYRTGSPCEEGLVLIVAEAERILLIRPKDQRIIPFVPDAAGIFDITFFPKSFPFNPGVSASVILAERRPGIGASRILRIPVGEAFDNQPPLRVALAGSILPLRDPAGDNFESDLTADEGLRPIDLIGVNAQAFTAGVAIVLRFAHPVQPLRLQQPHSLAGFIDFDFQPGGGPSHVEQYNPFNVSGRIGMDAYVDLALGQLVGGGNSIPIPVRYQRDVVVAWIPHGFFDTLRARIGVVVGNRAEMTDIAPNAGLVRIAP